LLKTIFNYIFTCLKIHIPGVRVEQLIFNIPIHDKSNTGSIEKTPIRGRKSIRGANRTQIEFKCACLDDLIPKDHRARDVWDYVSELDLSCFHDHIRIPEGSKGPRTADPKILLAIWLFAILQGEVSARKINKLCTEHHAYIWLCGGISVNYHTLSDFRNIGGDRLQKLLQESIGVMWKSGIFNPEDVAQDGTRVKASAGTDTLRRDITLEKYLEEANLYLIKLEKEHKANPSASTLREKAARERAAKERKERLERARAELLDYKNHRIQSSKANHHKLSQEDLDDMRASITDPDCRKMKMSHGGFRPAFNVQFATSVDKKVILGVDVVQTMDQGTLCPMMSQVKDNLEAVGCPMPKTWLADSAYANKNDADKAEHEFSDVVLYSTPTSNGKTDAFTPRATDNTAMANLRKRMSTKEAQSKYKKRASTAEFANAMAKNRGMHEFLIRGLRKVKNMAMIYAIVHNMSMYFTYS